FEAAAADGDARARAGEDKYQKAADAARAEGAELRASLGVLRVRLVRPVPGAHVDAEGRPHPVRADGTAVVLHRPGVVRAVGSARAATAAQLEATLAAGRWTDVDVTLAAAPAPAPPRREEKRAAPFELPLGAGLGGFGLVGLGSFTLFGLRSQSTFDDLSS